MRFRICLGSPLADYLLFLLVTGLGRREAVRLTWNDADLQHWTLAIAGAKRPLALPLLNFLVSEVAHVFRHGVRRF